MAGPATRDLALYRGDDYSHRLTFVNDGDPPVALNLTDYTFKAQIRDRPEGGTIILATFDIDVSQASDGIIVLSLPAARTRIVTSPCYWDLQVNDGSRLQTWLKGTVTLSGDVTQDVEAL